MSKIEVNTVAPQCGTTLTLGESGDTVTLGSGASQSGFGRTGTVDWQTSIKTSTITAVNGEGYFVNTTGGAINANLPAGSAGAIVAFRDYANTFDSNNLTISSNGSEKINGGTLDLTVSTEGESLTLVYADATKGWLVVNDGNNDAGSQAEFVTATGGTITCCGNYKIHTFTGPGTFAVSNAGNPSGSTTVDYLVVAGGGGSGQNYGGGSGAGGYRESVPSPAVWTASPIANPGGALPVSVQSYPIAVGSGGAAGSDSDGGVGGNSVFSTITSTGGGGGGGSCGAQPGNPGGSGGGGGGSSASSAGAGNTPPVSPPQGQPGGSTGGAGAAAGGGATEAGGAYPGPAKGGDGAGTAINPASPVGTPGPSGPLRYFAGGGAGQGASGGTGGGASPGNGGTINTGGGAGNEGQTGGSGIVIIRYKFQ